MFSFLDIRLIDIVDIVLSAYLMYSIYRLIKGTMAASIVMSISAFLIFWVLVRALGMSMLSAVMGSFVNIGLLALIVIFQQEIRTFLIMLSTRHSLFKRLGLDPSMEKTDAAENAVFLDSIVKACESMSKTQTGALIVVARKVGLKDYIETGDKLSAHFSQQLIETIFFKNTPLHDGAMIVDKHHIIAAGCILPVSKDMTLPKTFGLRHRSAMGVTEVTDAVSIVVSEETGGITVFEHGNLQHIEDSQELYKYLKTI
ncbi:MAG: diadenylate cyclase CdaA [Bacteroidales bacterium]|nr:diadenylate cyclase CdaA [Bacteroidales bacterium]MDY4174524.1 diadenylate cyclase CdaA [Bacteroidales bacterium]